MGRRYPAFLRPRLPLARALAEGGGPVAGRLSGKPAAGWLRDASGLEALSWDAAAANPGDIVAGRLVLSPRGNRLGDIQVLAPCLPEARPPGEDELEDVRWRELRAGVIDSIRGFFRERGFVEVATPTRVRCPGLEPHLKALATGGGGWLRTSPELALKRLLARGMERIFELARVYRDEEAGCWHIGEFDLLEWYRAYEGLEAVAADLEALLPHVAAAMGHDPSRVAGGLSLDSPFERVTVRDAVRRQTGLDLAKLRGEEALRAALRRRGHPTSDDDDWDTLFYKLWLAEVEPDLGHERPTLVLDYPASQAALARVRPDPEWPVAERFELYVAGIELANAFHELNDPVEQRRRHEADQATRRDLGADVYALDEAFLGALEAGMPPAAGIAFGVDRLVALLGGRESILPLGDAPEV